MRVADRAPVLFGARRDLHDIREDAIAIGAVGAIDSLKQIQVAKLSPVENDEVGAPHFGDAVQRKREGLKDRDKQIQQNEWNNASVNERRGQTHEEAGLPHETQQRSARLDMILFDFIREMNDARAHIVKRAAVIVIAFRLAGNLYKGFRFIGIFAAQVSS